MTGGTQGLGAAIARLFAQAEAAGIAIVGKAEAQFGRIFAVNVRAPFFLMQVTVKAMARCEAEGAILNIVGVGVGAGRSTLFGRLFGIERCFVHPDAKLWLRVDAQPCEGQSTGYRLDGVRHERAVQLQETGPPDREEKAAATPPFGRLLDPVEVAKAALWIVSPDSGMMTGAVIPFDPSVWGGYDGQASSPGGLLT